MSDNDVSTYTITVLNHSGVPRAYFLFTEVPTVTGPTGSSVFQNVWLKSPEVHSPNGASDFIIQKEFYGITGTSQTKLDINVIVKTSDWDTVKLAGDGNNGTHLLMTGKPGDAANFDPTGKSDTCEQAGSYEIFCHDFQVGNGANQYIGLGGHDPDHPGKIVPIASFAAMPETTNIITPVIKYYVSWGTVAQGQIINYKTYAVPAKIDFTGKSTKSVTVVDKPDGKWEIQFDK